VKPNIVKEKIINDVLSLPMQTRAYLAEILLESLDNEKFELSPEWKEEIKKRCKEIDDGIVDLIPAEQVFKEINKEL